MTQTNAHTHNLHKQTHTHLKYTNNHTHAKTHTHINYTDKHTHIHTYTHTHTHTYTHTHTHAQMETIKQWRAGQNSHLIGSADVAGRLHKGGTDWAKRMAGSNMLPQH